MPPATGIADKSHLGVLAEIRDFGRVYYQRQSSIRATDGAGLFDRTLQEFTSLSEYVPFGDFEGSREKKQTRLA